MDQPILPYIQKYKRYYQAVGPMLEKKQTKTYSTLILFVLVISLFGWYAIRPTLQTIIYLRREIADKTDLSKKMDQKINALIEAASLLETSSESISILSEALPQSPEPFPLMEGMRALSLASQASVSGVQIHSVPLDSENSSPSGKTEKSDTMGMNEMEFMLAVDGSYENITGFIRRVLALRRVLHIKNINFVPGTIKISSTSARPTLRMLFDGVGYYGSIKSL